LSFHNTLHCLRASQNYLQAYAQLFFEGDLQLGDCLQLMSKIPNKSVDMICCDLPYGTTKCKWDTCIDLQELWRHYRRITKPNSAIILFAQTLLFLSFHNILHHLNSLQNYLQAYAQLFFEGCR
jgi:DNA modification methylase